MINIAIVDDEQNCLESLKKSLTTILDEESISHTISTYSSSLIYLQKAQKKHFDIIFLDIEMDSMNGIELAHSIRENDEKVIIIFQTKMGKYAIQGYSVNAYDYILKPIDIENLRLKMHRIILKLNKENNKTIVIRTRDESNVINLDSIIYIEVMSHTVTFHTDSGDYDAYNSLSSFDDQLAKVDYFVRISRFIVINTKRITSMKGNSLYIGKLEFSIGRKQKKELKEVANRLLDKE